MSDTTTTIAPDLPEEFTLPIEDDSMAPALEKGGIGLYSRVWKREAGGMVLIRTRSGELVTRDYRPLDDEHFLAEPRNPGYSAFDSRTEPLTIVAVCISCYAARRPKRWYGKASQAARG